MINGQPGAVVLGSYPQRRLGRIQPGRLATHDVYGLSHPDSTRCLGVAQDILAK